MPLPTISLQYDTDGQTLATFECDPSRITGRRSFAGGMLWLPFQQMGKTYNGAAITFVYGQLAMFADESGLPIPAQPLIRNKGHLEVPITDEQLAALERERGGRLLEMRLIVEGTATYNGGTVGVRSPHAPTLQIHEKWLTTLNALGFGSRRIVELPAMPTNIGGSWDDAAQRIQQATQRIAAGDVGVALAETRIALERTVESIGALLGRPREEKEAVRNYFNAVATLAESRHVSHSDDPFEAIAAAIRLGYATFRWTSEPQHAALNAGERANAELALAIVTALYVYGVRLRALAPPIAVS